MSLTTNQSMVEDNISVLKKSKLFAETENNIIEEIARILIELKFKSGQAIFRKGDEGDAMFIIKEGKVRVHDGNHVLSRLEPGEFFGEFALLDNESRSASITAEVPTTLLKLKQDDFYTIMADNIEVTKGVLRNVIRRIREMNELESKLAKSYLKIQNQKKEIEQRNQNILEQQKELEQTNEQLLNLNEEKNQLIGVVSHGLRNPLTSSLCVIDLLEFEKENLSPEQGEYIRLIHSSLRRMNSLINQTLDIDLIELQRKKLALEKVNLAEILEQLKKSFKYTLAIKKIKIDLQLQDLYVSADRNFIYLIFDNLLSNAIRFSPPDKKITIDLFEKEDKILVEISDEGPGISNEALQTLFDKPQAHDRQTDKTGLSIVKKYVEVMNGVVQCKSRPGQGTTFIVQFDSIQL